MPGFHLMKEKRGWRVMDNKGNYYSKRSLTKKNATAQMRALYASYNNGSFMYGKGYASYTDGDNHCLILSGNGIFSGLWSKIKNVTNLVTSKFTSANLGATSDILSTAVRLDYPPQARNTLNKYGLGVVYKLQIIRDPIKSYIDDVLNIISIGQWNIAKQKMNYDRMFHLSMIASLSLPNGDKVNVKIEKNEVISITDQFVIDKDAQYIEVSVPCCITLIQMMNRTSEKIGTNFYRYDAFNNNCQMFIMNILDTNGLSTSEVREFILQDAKKLLSQLPEYMSPFANVVTNLAAVTNRLIKGNGLEMNAKGTIYRGGVNTPPGTPPRTPPRRITNRREPPPLRNRDRIPSPPPGSPIEGVERNVQPRLFFEGNNEENNEQPFYDMYITENEEDDNRRNNRRNNRRQRRQRINRRNDFIRTRSPSPVQEVANEDDSEVEESLSIAEDNERRRRRSRSRSPQTPPRRQRQMFFGRGSEEKNKGFVYVPSDKKNKVGKYIWTGPAEDFQKNWSKKQIDDMLRLRNQELKRTGGPKAPIVSREAQTTMDYAAAHPESQLGNPGYDQYTYDNNPVINLDPGKAPVDKTTGAKAQWARKRTDGSYEIHYDNGSVEFTPSILDNWIRNSADGTSYQEMDYKENVIPKKIEGLKRAQNKAWENQSGFDKFTSNITDSLTGVADFVSNVIPLPGVADAAGQIYQIFRPGTREEREAQARAELYNREMAKKGSYETFTNDPKYAGLLSSDTTGYESLRPDIVERYQQQYEPTTLGEGKPKTKADLRFNAIPLTQHISGSGQYKDRLAQIKESYVKSLNRRIFRTEQLRRTDTYRDIIMTINATYNDILDEMEAVESPVNRANFSSNIRRARKEDLINEFKNDINNIEARIIAYLNEGNRLARQVNEDPEPIQQNTVTDTDPEPVADTNTNTDEDPEYIGYGSRTFIKELKQIGMTPSEYLQKARQSASRNGYDSDKIELATDGKHKLCILTDDNLKRCFGRVGNNDFIMWSHLESLGEVNKGYSEMKRRIFHSSHSKIRGNWKSDKFSPNMLALKINW